MAYYKQHKLRSCRASSYDANQSYASNERSEVTETSRSKTGRCVSTDLLSYVVSLYTMLIASHYKIRSFTSARITLDNLY